MGIQICSNKGYGSIWGPIRGNIRKILINLQKYSSYLAWSKEIQVCSNKVPRLMYGPTPGD